MIFWILVAIVLILAIAAFFAIHEEGEGFWSSLGAAIVSAIVSSMIAGLIFLMACVISYTATGWNYLDTWSTTKDTHSLTALKTDSSVEGRSYFLGGGYIDGKRVLNYIQADDNAFYVKSSDADESVIHESSKKPEVVHTHWVGGFWWLAPFPMGSGDVYDFYVPKGSVLSDYTVDNG